MMVVPAKAGTHNLRPVGCDALLRVHSREPPLRNTVHRSDQRYRTQARTTPIWRRLILHARVQGVRLVHIEVFDDPVSAITREKQMKKWNRDWKIRLIEEGNPDWSDLTHLLQ